MIGPPKKPRPSVKAVALMMKLLDTTSDRRHTVAMIPARRRRGAYVINGGVGERRLLPSVSTLLYYSSRNILAELLISVRNIIHRPHYLVGSVGYLSLHRLLRLRCNAFIKSFRRIHNICQTLRLGDLFSIFRHSLSVFTSSTLHGNGRNIVD